MNCIFLSESVLNEGLRKPPGNQSVFSLILKWFLGLCDIEVSSGESGASTIPGEKDRQLELNPKNIYLS